jgi:hypothetical protein
MFSAPCVYFFESWVSSSSAILSQAWAIDSIDCLSSSRRAASLRHSSANDRYSATVFMVYRTHRPRITAAAVVAVAGAAGLHHQTIRCRARPVQPNRRSAPPFPRDGQQQGRRRGLIWPIDGLAPPFPDNCLSCPTTSRPQVTVVRKRSGGRPEIKKYLRTWHPSSTFQVSAGPRPECRRVATVDYAGLALGNNT